MLQQVPPLYLCSTMLTCSGASTIDKAEFLGKQLLSYLDSLRRQWNESQHKPKGQAELDCSCILEAAF